MRDTTDAEGRPVEPCPYEVLGVTRGATQVELRSAYRRLARLHHPDRPQGSAAAFARIAAAYALVGDDGRRAAHDARTRPPAPAPAPAPAYLAPDLSHVGATRADLDARWEALVADQVRRPWWSRAPRWR